MKAEEKDSFARRRVNALGMRRPEPKQSRQNFGSSTSHGYKSDSSRFRYFAMNTSRRNNLCINAGANESLVHLEIAHFSVYLHIWTQLGSSLKLQSWSSAEIIHFVYRQFDWLNKWYFWKNHVVCNFSITHWEKCLENYYCVTLKKLLFSTGKYKCTKSNFLAAEFTVDMSKIIIWKIKIIIFPNEQWENDEIWCWNRTLYMK